MHKVTLNDGQTVDVADRDDWKTSIDQDFKPGDYFCEEIAWDLINAVPPHLLEGGYFQCGEPQSHCQDSAGRYRPVYLTLEKVNQAPEVWHFCGYCFSFEKENRL